MFNKEIQTNFNKIIEYNINELSPYISIEKLQGTDKIFDIYQHNKKFFYSKFNQQLIYESPEEVNIILGKEEKQQLFSDFIDTLKYEYYAPESLLRFLSLNESGFFDNEVVCDYYKESTDTKPLILKGSKIVKSFKFFISNSAKLINLQNIASQVIQQGIVKGTLCLSIHPLDYLSASDNTYNWRSCYSLDGEYRVGGLAYMLDSCTIMAYLRGKTNENLKNFPPDVLWNSKKWRCWIFRSHNGEVFFAGKQYPYNSVTLLDMVHNCLCNIFGDYAPWNDEYFSPRNYFNMYKLHDTVFDFKQYFPIGDELVCLEDIISSDVNGITYNDLLYSSTYIKPYYCYKIAATFYLDHFIVDSINNIHIKDRDRRPIKIFTIGHEVPCPVCGEENLVHSERFFCNECKEKYYTSKNCCIYCGRHIKSQDDYHIIRGQHVCNNCYNNHIIHCDRCGVAELDDCISMIKENGKTINLCRDCYREEYI